MPSDANVPGSGQTFGMAEMERCAERGDAATARAIARHVAAAVANDADAIARLSFILEDFAALDIAEEVVGAAVQNSPGELWIAVRHAVIADRRGATAAAVARWSHVRRCWPEAAIGGIGLAGMRLARGDYQGAERLFREVATRFPGEVWAADGLASVASARRDWPAAVALWTDVHARFPDHARAAERLAEALDHQRGQTDYIEAIAAEDAGNYVLAARCWRSVIEVFPDRPEPVLRLDAVDTILGRPRHRVDTLRAAVARFPDHLGIRRALLGAAEADGDTALALETLTWLSAHTTDDRARMHAGAALRRLLDTTARYPDFRKILLLALATPGDGSRRALTGFLSETAFLWPERRAWTRLVLDEAAISPDLPAVHLAACQAILETKPLVPIANQPENLPSPDDIRFLPLDAAIENAASPLESLHRRARAVLAHINPFVLDRRMRRYQADIVRTGTISFGDLFGAPPPAFAGCIYYADPKAFAYRFVADGLKLWLITGEAADGYRIVAFFDEASAAVLYDSAHLPAAPGKFLGRRIRDINDARGSGVTRRAEDAGKIVLVSGYDNYAHYMWNELPALLDIPGWASTKIDEIAVIFEPFGPFADIAGWPWSPPVRPTSNAELCRAGNLHADLLFAPGSIVVTPATRQHLRDVCRAHAREKYSAPSGKFTIWISLRRMYRRAVNLPALLERVFARIEQAGLECEIILDGFSTPFDVAIAHRYDSDYFLRHREMAAADARALIDSIGPKSAKIRLLDATAADIPTAIALTERADFYVCHHGTQQHKIGWLADIPGVIHGNETICRQDSVARWVQAQCDSPIQPRYIPADLVRDTATDNERQEIPSFRDYEFAPLDACADFVFKEIQGAHDRWRAA